ncbi:MAG: prefoldin subunit alpha [Candidatus Micrarchaeia archaeon]
MENSDNTEEDINRLTYLQAVYTQQYELISNEIATYSLAQETLLRNKDLLENAKGIEDSNVLMNSGNIFFEAKTGKMDKVLVYVGAGYVLEKTAEEAKKFVDERSKETAEILEKLVKERSKIEQTLVEINYSLSALQSKAQQ